MDDPSGVVMMYRYGSLCCSIAMILIAVLGIIGNVVSACVFSDQRRRCSSPQPSPSNNHHHQSVKSRSSINVLLIGLTITDTVLLVLAGPLFSMIAFSNWAPDNPLLVTPIAYMTVYAYPACMMSQCASGWIILVISVERYWAVCRPLTNMKTRRSKLTLSIVIGAAIAYNVCRYGEYRLNDHYNGTIALLRKDSAYVAAYVHWSYFFLVFAVPCLVLLIVNSLIVRTIFKARRQRRLMLLTQHNLREHRTALMMASVVMAYLACNTLALVLNAFEAVAYLDGAPFLAQLDQDLFRFLCDLNNLFIAGHSALTFLVYYRFSGHFRTYVRDRLTTCNQKRRSHSVDARKESNEPNKYRRPWSSIGSYTSQKGQRLLTIQMGHKRRMMRGSWESQLDPFYA